MTATQDEFTEQKRTMQMSMLYPRDSESRQVKDLSGFWNFRCDLKNEGREQNWQDQPLRDAMAMPVPASFNDLTQDRRIRDHVGDVWYETEEFVPATWQGQRVVLRFGAAAHRAVVWINGQQVAEHKGGYLPFEEDVSEVVTYGQSNRITVVVNNILDGETIPPGWIKTVESKNFPEGYKYQDYEFDFFNYAGLHRPVKFYTTPRTYIDDISVITDVEGSDGIVQYSVSLAGGEGDISAALLDEDGNEVASASGADGELRVSNANLWQPGAAYLYTLVARVGEDGDVYRLPVGIRTVEIRDGKFLINGEAFYFRGFGKHEDMDIKGRALDHAMVRKDFSLLEWIGANSFRTSHYPYAEEIMQMADREGIVVIDESPAVGMY
ncbi:MAG: glycoside hydrolase family 2 TIM barrel-domain containing protein, partial [Planctomycetota bacterium]